MNPSAETTPTILVLNDDLAFTEMVADRLSELGYNVDTATTPEQTKKLLSDNDYALIVSDIDRLGDPTPDPFLLENASLTQDANRIVFTTAFSADEVNQRLRERGFRVIQKSSSLIERLKEIVSEVSIPESSDAHPQLANSRPRGDSTIQVKMELAQRLSSESVSPLVRHVLRVGGSTALESSRTLDSTLLLATIIICAVNRPDDSGHALFNALRDQETSSINETSTLESAALTIVQGMGISAFSTHFQSQQLEEIPFASDVEVIILKALEFSKEANIQQVFQPRHLLGVMLSPLSPIPSVHSRLRELGLNADRMRKDLLDFIKSQKREDLARWEGILFPLDESGDSIVTSNVSDQPARKDALGFKPYVRAVAEFLSNPQTVPPLTLSVEGEWGSGKSSFMLQLEAKLKSLSALSGRKCPTVRFNAWRHDKEDALWASFAIEFIKQLSKQLSLHRRLWAYCRLVALRFRWRDGWAALLRTLILLFVFLFISGVLASLLYSNGLEDVIRSKSVSQPTPSPSSNNVNPPAVVRDTSEKLPIDPIFIRLVKASGIVGYLAFFMFFLLKLRGYLGHPLAVNLTRYVDSPKYKDHVAFIENFHEDFARIVKTYGGKDKVYVFIDDLDRCEVPRAADLMQALNLMISDSPQLVFVIGMDREKVAAGLAVKYEKLLPYLNPSHPYDVITNEEQGSGKKLTVKLDGKAPDAWAGMEYGFAFIEKFIQLPFRVPQPDERELRTLLNHVSPRGKTVGPHIKDEHISGMPRAANETDAARRDGREPQSLTINNASDSGRADRAVSNETREADETSLATDQLERKELFKLRAIGDLEDSETIRNIVMMVAPALDFNPRRLKQFINMFRLKAFIAAETGLNESLTLEQLGKLVAISLRWPRLLSEIEANHGLLAELEQSTFEHDNQSSQATVAGHYWSSKKQLLDLLNYGCKDHAGDLSDVNRYTLKSVDINLILRVSVDHRNASLTSTSAY